MLSQGAQMRKRKTLSMILLLVCSIIFRFEISILLLYQTVNLLIEENGRIKRNWQDWKNRLKTFKNKVILPFLLTTISSIGISILIDGRLWKLNGMWWPEATVFWFNIIENKSSNWGTSPWYWYFVKALPNLMMISYPLLIMAILTNSRMRRKIALLPLFFIMAFSCLPHKETRFLFPIIPILNLATAMFCHKITKEIRIKKWKEEGGEREKLKENKDEIKIKKSKRIKIMLNLLFFQCFLLSTFKLYISTFNYYGANALKSVHDHMKLSQSFNLKGESLKSIYIEDEAAMNGINLFQQYFSNVM